jgi:hypothetical protein
MAYAQEVINAVRRSFINEQLPLEAAADKHGIPVGTAHRWKKSAEAKGDNWETLKTAYVMTAGGLEEVSHHVLMSFMVQYRSVMDELTTNPDIAPVVRADKIVSLADAFNKMTAASRRVLPEVSRLVVALDVVDKFAEYVQKNRPDALGVFLELLEGFAREVEALYGKG